MGSQLIGIHKSFLIPKFPLAIFFLLLLLPIAALAQDTDNPVDTTIVDSVSDSIITALTPQSAFDIVAADVSNDAGGSINVTWEISPDDNSIDNKVTQYRVMRAVVIDGQPGEFVHVGENVAGSNRYADGNTQDGVKYIYKIVTINKVVIDNEKTELIAESELSEIVQSSAQWFHLGTS